MKCPHCKEYLFFFERVIKEINYCPFCGERIKRISENHFDIPKVVFDQKVKIGDTITYGVYLQDKDYPTRIPWIVVDRKDNCALIQSKYALDYMIYNEKNKDTTWNHSLIRHFLNEEFFSKAFGEAESNGILFTSMEDHGSFLSDSPMNHSVYELMEDYDRIFLPTTTDMERLSYDKEMYQKQGTDYAKKQGAVSYGPDKSVWWWTQTPSEISKNLKFVTPFGTICNYGSDYRTKGSICPMMWIKL